MIYTVSMITRPESGRRRRGRPRKRWRDDLGAHHEGWFEMAQEKSTWKVIREAFAQLWGIQGCSMFSIRKPVSICMRIKQATPLKFQTRPASSLFHRGVRFFFKKNLFLTNSVTSGLCMLLGDFIQQEFEYQTKVLPKRYDWNRAGRMFTVGMVMGPLHHFYYVYLDKMLPKANLKTVLLKIFFDQGCASPLTILGFYYTLGVLEQKLLPEITSEIKKKFLYTYMGDCMFWPPVQFINFYFLPTQYRVVYINVATILFNIFLSFVKHYDHPKS